MPEHALPARSLAHSRLTRLRGAAPVALAMTMGWAGPVSALDLAPLCEIAMIAQGMVADAPADSTVSGTIAPPDSVETASPWPDVPEASHEPGALTRAAHTVRDIAADTWYVVSAPARLDRRNALQLAAVLGVTGVLFAYDEPLFRAVKRGEANGVTGAVLDVGEAIGPIGLMERTLKIYAAAFALGTLIDFDGLQAVSGEIITSHLIASGVRNVARPLVGRLRPSNFAGPRSFAIGDERESFPSGHTSVYFELATIVSHHAHSVPIATVAYGLATAGALARIDSGAHWPSDVFISAVSGTLIARMVIRRSEDRKALQAYVRHDTGVPQMGVCIRF